MSDSERTRTDWEVLGRADPLWAVLVRGRPGRKTWTTEEFLATGRAEVAAVVQHAAELGIRPNGGAALDFGCGAGRLTAALAAHFEHVVGVDVSASMLATARAIANNPRCRFALNDRDDLSVFADRSFDLVMSSLVLQHVPPASARTYLGEMLRVCREPGVVIVQVATEPDGSLRGALTRSLPRAALRFAQRHILRYPAPMDMYATSHSEIEHAAAAYGARIVDAVPESMYGGHWRYRRYYLARG